MDEVLVYLITGFLESGKTTFAQQTLGDNRFTKGSKTLVILCEEGEVELDPAEFGEGEIFLETLTDVQELTPPNLSKLLNKHGADKVLIEYNGMWQLADLYNALPEEWIIEQQILLVDSTTFDMYNSNMRSLVVDKIQPTDTVVFNRVKPGQDTMFFHKVVRGLSRQCNIIYEDEDHKVTYDETEDPLPYDMNAPIVDIADKDYAIFYADICENMSNYDGKKLRFTAVVAKDDGLGNDSVFVGRHVMTCCVEDIRYSAMVCKTDKAPGLKSYDWVKVTGKVVLKKHRAYESVGPVIIADSVVPARQPDDPVATFY